MVHWVSHGHDARNHKRFARQGPHRAGLRSWPDADEPMALRGLKVVVVGAGRSGVAAVRFLLRQGAKVTLSDRRGPESLGLIAVELSKLGAKIAEEGHPSTVLNGADLIVLSPGVPRSIQPLQEAEAKGVNIIGEVELAARHLSAPLIGITGTNGKSTTTTFIGQFLRGCGHRAFVGGNLGTPLIEAAEGDSDLVVAELSSYQLESIDTLRPHVALLLNVSEDHLSRYNSFEHYAETKARLFQNQGADDFVVVNHDDPLAMELAKTSAGKIYSFSISTPVEAGAYFDGQRILVGENGHFEALELGEFRPKGSHNIENLMAAVVACYLSEIPLEALHRCFGGLEGLPHRMEWVADIEGVSYYNDSKATNVASVVATLSGLAEPLIVLLGGRDKGGSYEQLKLILQNKARQVVLYGEAKRRLQGSLKGCAPIECVDTLEEALVFSHGLAKSGDMVILSPACSSFDQFDNYAQRGARFRQLVTRMAMGDGVEQ